MSYVPVQAPTVAAPRRPVTVTAASLLLAVMAVAGLGYAIATLAVVPGVVERFRAGAGSVAADDVDGVVGLIWIGAGVAVAVAVLLFGLYVALALALRRGSNAARICTWVVCALGLLAGCASAVTVMAQQGSSDDFGGVAGPLDAAYPSAWISANVALAVAQMLGYVTVAGLLLAAPGHFFARHPAGGAPPAAPGPYGAYGALPGMPGLYPTPGAPGAATAPVSAPGAPAAPGPYGAPYAGAPASPYGSPYAPPPAPYGPPNGGYGPSTPYGPPATAPGPSGPAGAAAPPPAPGQPIVPAPGDSDGNDQYWSRPPA